MAEDFKGIGDVTFYANNQEIAGATPLNLKPSDEFTIGIKIQLKKDSNVTISIRASGFRDDEPQPFTVVSGPSAFGHTGETYSKKAGETIELTWKLKSTNTWTGGTAPVNLGLTFRDPVTLKGDPLLRTIANIYIEPTGGATSAPAATPRQPGFELGVALGAIVLMAVAFRRFV